MRRISLFGPREGAPPRQGRTREHAHFGPDARSLGAGGRAAAASPPQGRPRAIREVGRIGGNLNQIARWLNSATAAGLAREIDALAVAAELVAIERALGAILARPAPEPDQPTC